MKLTDKEIKAGELAEERFLASEKERLEKVREKEDRANAYFKWALSEATPPEGWQKALEKSIELGRQSVGAQVKAPNGDTFVVEMSVRVVSRAWSTIEYEKPHQPKPSPMKYINVNISKKEIMESAEKLRADKIALAWDALPHGHYDLELGLKLLKEGEMISESQGCGFAVKYTPAYMLDKKRNEE